MQYLRYATGAVAGFGLHEAGRITPMDAAPWDGGLPSGPAIDHDAVRILAPTSPTKIVCVGRNYRDHIEEMGYEIPRFPTIFYKPLTTLLDPEGDVELPPSSLTDRIEHEAELAVVIGRTCRHLSPATALDAVFGVTCANDVSSRDLPRSDGNNVRAKSFDTFCPLGPWIETEVDLTRGVDVRCRVNGELRQNGNTEQLVFDIPTILAVITEAMTLLPGDVVLTGSPGGSGPLAPGDQVDIEVAGVGHLHHGVRSAP